VRVALVTGAARGIGAATARRLAAAGWGVVAIDRAENDPRLPYDLGTRDELESLAELGPNVTTYVADAGDADALAAAARRAESEYGGLDAFIAVAGVVAGGVPLWEMDVEQQAAVIETNLTAVAVGARVGIPALLRRPTPREGRFIAVSSTAAVRAMPLLTAYAAAKAGVEALVRGLAAELRGTGVTANSVRPGSTETRGLDESARLYGLESARAFAHQHTIERLIDPAEVAAGLEWLAGAGSGAITGASLSIDGGLSL
jgi:SDR family mycofactocin-dependent oxidoreductase